MKSFQYLMFVFLLAALFTGCARYGVIPERLEDQAKHQLRFADVRDHPDEYKGELMEIGEVLSIKRLEDRGYSCRRGLGSEIIQVEKEEKNVLVFGTKDLSIWDKEQMRGTPNYGYGLGYPTGFYSGYHSLGYPYY